MGVLAGAHTGGVSYGLAATAVASAAVSVAKSSTACWTGASSAAVAPFARAASMPARILTPIVPSSVVADCITPLVLVI